MKIFEKLKELVIGDSSFDAGVGDHDFGRPVQKPWGIIEDLPSKACDIVIKPLGETHNCTCSIYDSSLYQTIDDATRAIEFTAFRLLRYVKPQNLFFLFGEGFEFFYDSIPEFPTPENWGKHIKNLLADPNGSNTNHKASKKQENQADPFSIVICRGIYPQFIQHIIGNNVNNAASNPKNGYICWAEFLKKIEETSNQIEHKPQNKS